MRWCTVLLVLMLFGFCAAGQKRAPVPEPTKEDYLKKSASQQRTGITLLAGGTTMLIIGVIGFNNTYDTSSNGGTDAFGFLFLGGLVMDIASIPCFVRSAQNARKAATMVSLENKPLMLPGHSATATSFQPSVTVTFRLR